MKPQRGTILLYGLIALGVVASLAGLYAFVDGRGYSRGSLEKQAEWNEANRLEAERQEREDTARRKASTQKDLEHAKAYNDLKGRYDTARRDLRRLSSQQPSGDKQAINLSSAASGIACPDRQADVARRLEWLEEGILGLLQRGDEAITRTQTCKAWLDDQLAIEVR